MNDVTPTGLGPTLELSTKPCVPAGLHPTPVHFHCVCPLSAFCCVTPPIREKQVGGPGSSSTSPRHRCVVAEASVEGPVGRHPPDTAWLKNSGHAVPSLSFPTHQALNVALLCTKY